MPRAIYVDYAGLITVAFGEQNPDNYRCHSCGPSVFDAFSYAEKIFPSELG
jgi:hypothetical protein